MLLLTFQFDSVAIAVNTLTQVLNNWRRMSWDKSLSIFFGFLIGVSWVALCGEWFIFLCWGVVIFQWLQPSALPFVFWSTVFCYMHCGSLLYWCGLSWVCVLESCMILSRSVDALVNCWMFLPIDTRYSSMGFGLLWICGLLYHDFSNVDCYGFV